MSNISLIVIISIISKIFFIILDETLTFFVNGTIVGTDSTSTASHGNKIPLQTTCKAIYLSDITVWYNNMRKIHIKHLYDTGKSI